MTSNTSFAPGHAYGTIWATSSPNLIAALRSVDDIEKTDRAIDAVVTRLQRAQEASSAGNHDELVDAVMIAAMSDGAIGTAAEDRIRDAAVARQAASESVAIFGKARDQLVYVREQAFVNHVDDVLRFLHDRLTEVMADAAAVDLNSVPANSRDAIHRNEVEAYRHVEALAVRYEDIRSAQHRVDNLHRHRSLPTYYKQARLWRDVIGLAGGATRTSAALRSTYVERRDGTRDYPVLAGPGQPGTIGELMWLAHGPATAWVPTTAELDDAVAVLHECATMHADTARVRYDQRTTH